MTTTNAQTPEKTESVEHLPNEISPWYDESTSYNAVIEPLIIAVALITGGSGFVLALDWFFR